MNSRPVKSGTEELTNGRVERPHTQPLRCVWAAPPTGPATLPVLPEEGGAVHLSNGVWMKPESKKFCNESLPFIMGITL